MIVNKQAWARIFYTGYHFQAILNRSRKCQLRLEIFKLARMPPFPSADDERVETPSEFFYIKKKTMWNRNYWDSLGLVSQGIIPKYFYEWQRFFEPMRFT